MTVVFLRVGMGVLESQLSAKLSPISQLSAKRGQKPRLWHLYIQLDEKVAKHELSLDW